MVACGAAGAVGGWVVACGPGVLLVQLEVEWLPVVADQQQSILHTPGGQKRRFPFLSGQVPPKTAVSLETSSKNGDVGRCCFKTFYVENGRFA